MSSSSYDDGHWTPDRQVKVESPTAPCPTVEVVLEGEALEKKRLCGGIYHVVDGMWSAGRQVNVFTIINIDQTNTRCTNKKKVVGFIFWCAHRT